MISKVGLARRSALKWVIAGALLGFAVAWLQPRRYLAETLVYFPTINVKLYVQLTQALQASPGEDSVVASVPAQEAQVSQAARLIFTSRAAALYALKKAGLPLAPNWTGFDPVDTFRSNLKVELRAPSALFVQVQGFPADTCRILVQALLEYYTNFVQEQSLTHTARTQKRVQAMVDEVARNLYELEGQLAVSSEQELRELGDEAIQPDQKVMRQLWKKRLEQAAQSRKVLENLRKIRGGEEEGPDLWVSQWSPARPPGGPKAQGALKGSVRRQDMGARVKLEREYEDSLTIHRALVLQNSFLQTWASLEDHEFEVVDSVAVRAESKASLSLIFALAGAVLSGGVWFLTRLLRR